MTIRLETLPQRPFLTLAAAKQMAAAAEEAAARDNLKVVIAVVDAGGCLLYLQRDDEAQGASVEIAQLKARTAALYKKPSKAFEVRVSEGGRGLGALSLPGLLASEGGVPILADGLVIGAIGVSGAHSYQDGELAAAAIASLD